MQFTLPWTRPRVAAHAPHESESSGAQSRINAGVFGQGVLRLPFIDNPGSPYLYHEGDLFTPGAMNFVPEAQTELPVQNIWGHGMMALNPQMFDPRQQMGGPSWVYAPATTPAGLGGLQTGGIQFQPLEVGSSSVADYTENFVPQL